MWKWALMHKTPLLLRVAFPEALRWSLAPSEQKSGLCGPLELQAPGWLIPF